MDASTDNSINPYASHLANMGESKDVIASEDIFNENGSLLVKKGAPINKKISERIVRFKLLKPIEASVSIAQTITAKTITDDLNKTTSQIPELKAISDNLNLEKLFSQLALELIRYPLLVQKLTVMQSQLPDLYQQTFHVSWFTVAAARQMQLPAKTISNCFIAAATHDLGMMHIDPNIIRKKGSLTPEEWRQIQAHTVIGQKFLQEVPQLDSQVAKIVLEHHERCDGTGYPLGKFSYQISQESQIIALCDSLVSVYFNKLRRSGKTLRDIIPFLQVNSESHFYSNYTAVMSLLRQLKLKSNPTLDDASIEQAASDLIATNDKLSQRYNTTEEIISALSGNLEDKMLISAQKVLEQVMKTVRGSGILDPGYLRWIDQVKQEKLQIGYRELEDVSLMLEEIDWHLNRIIKMLKSYAEHSPNATEDTKNFIHERISALETPVEFEEYAIT